MKKNVNKKFIVFAIVVTFLSLTIAPTMGAVNQKIYRNLTDSYKKSTTSNCQTFDLLIITPVQFEKELESLADHKNDVGVSTIVITLDELYEETYLTGGDEPKKIKYFIKTAADEWGIQYVLLVGDFRQMPIRYVYNGDVNHGFHEPCFMPELIRREIPWPAYY